MDESSIFLEALKKPSPGERAAFLDQVCGGKDELRRSVELLLRAHDQAGAFLADSPAPAGVTVDHPAPESPGTVLGPYKLLEPIGEGGMGAVWLAQQTAPVKRLVAVKLIKAGMDSRQVIARFEAERQALALMDHPNIARVLDGGTTGTGLPYFVMDLVKGVPITRYCDEHHLTPRQRLELFVPVCQAVQHAHQKGVIHRDIKPSNVLVALYDGRPVPKVIDFGVAKAAGQALTDKTLVTGFGTLVGTLEYMSPEQAEINQLDIDTRSDIYSLGVLLYELLTGSTPFTRKELEKAGMLEMLRVIREEEPSKPSTKLSTAEGLPTLAANRGTEPAKLTRLVKGELDWIVMKALEKDRNRRYETANGFAMDLQRFLADEPVAAGPPSAWYRLRKFVRRNKGPVITASLLMLSLVAGVVGTSWGMVSARSAEAHAIVDRDRALAAEADTRAFSEFLVQDVLSAPRAAGIQYGQGRDIKLVTALGQAEQTLGRRFANRPLAEATARHALGVTWRHLGDYPGAEAHLRRALEIRLKFLGEGHRDTRETQNSLGVLLTAMNRSSDAVPLLEAALAGVRAELGSDADTTLSIQGNLGRALSLADRRTEAVQLLEDAWSRCHGNSRITPGRRVNVQTELGMAYRLAGRMPEAVKNLEQALQSAREAFGPGHAFPMPALMLGICYRETGRVAEAGDRLDEALRRSRTLQGDDYPGTLGIMEDLARVYLEKKRLPEAVRLLEEALRLREVRSGPESSETFATVLWLARTTMNAGQRADARRHYDTALRIARRDDLAATPAVMFERALAYHSKDRPAESIPRFNELLELARAKRGADHADALRAMVWLADCHHDAGESAKARALYEELATLHAKKNGANARPVQVILHKLANLHESRKEYARSEALWRRIVAAARADSNDPLHHASQLSGLGSILLRQEKWAEAETVCRECLELREKKKEPQAWRVANARRLLGQALAGQRKFDEAEPLLLRGYEGLKEQEANIPTLGTQRLSETLESLVKLYKTWGKSNEAERWRKELEAFKNKTPEMKP